jgi:hypothetical protein
MNNERLLAESLLSGNARALNGTNRGAGERIVTEALVLVGDRVRAIEEQLAWLVRDLGKLASERDE